MTAGPFKVIDGTPPPDTPKERSRARLRKQPKPAGILRCHRCTGTALIEVKLGVELVNHKPRGGTKQLVCAVCLAQGEHVTVF